MDRYRFGIRRLLLLLAAPWILHAAGGWCSARGQQPLPPTAPSPPHEALLFFAGTWTIEKTPPEEKLLETCDWLPSGRRHMVCRSQWHTPAGLREGMSMFSYRAEDSTYLYYGLRSGGSVAAYEGKSVPGGFDFTSSGRAGAEGVRERITIRRVTPDRFRFTAESSTGDQPWKVDADLHFRRVTSSEQ